jgi:hypothetical protein
MCPKCRSLAPLLHRAFSAQCSACGAPVAQVQGAPPLLAPGDSASSLRGAGTGQSVAGVTAYVFSWITLALGLPLTALVAWGASLAADVVVWFTGLLGLATVGGSWAVWAVALLVGLPTILTSLGLRFASSWLKKQAMAARESRTREIVHALAAARAGLVRPEEAALYLGASASDASSALARLASNDPMGVDLDVADDGDLRYRFKVFAPHEGDSLRTRIAALEDAPPRAAAATHAASGELDPPSAPVPPRRAS